MAREARDITPFPINDFPIFPRPDMNDHSTCVYEIQLGLLKGAPPPS